MTTLKDAKLKSLKDKIQSKNSVLNTEENKVVNVIEKIKGKIKKFKSKK